MRVVLGHGACVRDGGWWWHRTAELLARQGVSSTAPGLPSCGEAGVPAGGGGPGLAEDVAAVRGVLLVASYLPEVGQGLADFGDGDGAPAPFLHIDPGVGTFGVRPELLVDTFLQDCDPDVQAQAPAHLAWQSVQVTGRPVGAAAWRHVPTTYLVCAQDLGTQPRLQRESARRAGRVVEMDTGHHPFLSRPAAVADLVMGL